MSLLIDTFANRLRYAITIKDIKPIELSRKTGISKTNISCYMSGKYEAKQDGVKLLADALNVDPVWLMGYDVPMEKTPDNLLKKIGAIPLSDLNKDTVKIPVLGVVKAGYDYLAEENWQGTVDIKQELAKTGEFFALRIKGDSMFETLWNGDIVAVKKQNFAENGNIAVVLINGDEATVKQIKILDNGIKLMPLNRRINSETNEPYYEDMFFTKEDIETKPVKIIGIVKQIVERNFF